MPAIRTHPRSTLEVTTDAPMPPTLSIISPTPRAFTFAAAPSAPFLPSPSASPFEHGLSLKPLRLASPDALARTLTPESAASMSSPTFSSPSSSLRHSPAAPERARSRSREGRADDALAPAAASFACKRRKSTGGLTEPSERRPKRGDEDYVKRPENAFILFRRKCVEERLAAQAAADEEAAAAAAADNGPASKPKKHRQADLSKMISQQWRGLGAEERQYWEQLAKEKKKEHEKMYPDYVYRPQRTKRAKSNAVPPSKKGKGRADDQLEEVEESVEFELPLAAASLAQQRHGRSSSAPNAPVSTQTIRLPVVHMPSAPSSPLLLPSVPLNAIGRRPSVDWAAPHRPLEAQAVQSLFQPQYLSPQGSMDFQHAQFFPQGMYEIAAAPAPALEQPTLAPLMMPPTFFPGNHSPFSPADSTASPLSAYGSPFTPVAGVADQWARLSISSVSTDASELSEASTGLLSDGGAHHFGALPDLYEQPWAFEFVGEYVPGGAEFLTDDFDLSKIPQVALAEVCPDAAALGGVHPEPASAAAQAPHLHSAHGQDPYTGLFYDGALARY